VADRSDSEVEVAARLEREAQRVLEQSAGTRELALALDELRADRTNGESLAPAIEHLRRVLERSTASDQEDPR
jgi:hypothetical protein